MNQEHFKMQIFQIRRGIGLVQLLIEISLMRGAVWRTQGARILYTLGIRERRRHLAGIKVTKVSGLKEVMNIGQDGEERNIRAWGFPVRRRK